MRRIAILGAALLLAGGAATATATVVAPHALFIDHRTRSGVLYIQSQGDAPEEVSVALEFGYPVSDSLGGVRIQLIEEPGPDEPSAAGWVRALPARAVVAPGARQAVRLLALPPAGLPDGEYWSRVIVASRTAEPPVSASSDASVRVGLTLEMRTITSLTYRKGQVATGVRLDGFAAGIRGDTLDCDLRLARTGNAAYLGQLALVLTAEAGAEAGAAAGRWSQAIAVYRELHRRLSFPVGSLAPGRYTLRLRLSTEREDIPPADVLPAEPVERALELAVP